MSTDPFSPFSAGAQPRQEYAALAKEHFKHDLNDADRDAIVSAGKKIARYTAIGASLGFGLGVFWAFRLRRARLRMFNAFRAHEKPTHVRFADGREEAIPDLTPFLRPSFVGDLAAYTFFGLGCFSLGGAAGNGLGSVAAGRRINQDPESRKRIESGWKRFRADVLRKQADALHKQNAGEDTGREGLGDTLEPLLTTDGLGRE